MRLLVGLASSLMRLLMGLAGGVVGLLMGLFPRPPGVAQGPEHLLASLFGDCCSFADLVLGASALGDQVQ